MKSFKKTVKQIVIKEMVDLSLEQYYKKLDKVSNDTGKHKLIYEWTKTGHIDFKTYLKLVEYVQQDTGI